MAPRKRPANLPHYNRECDAFRYAGDLVRFLRDFRTRHGGSAIEDSRGFGVGVAGFPEGHPGRQS
jgi:methylenetetrahydrofolate reductase (NADPH)